MTNSIPGSDPNRKILLVYNEIPERMRMFLIPRLISEDFIKLVKCHNRYANLVEGLESDEVDWLNKFIEDHSYNLVFDSDKQDCDPIQVTNACMVVVTGFVL